MLRLRFLVSSGLRGGERDSERESSRRGAFLGGLRDREREDSLSYLLAFFRGGDRSLAGALPLRRGGDAERVTDRRRFGGGDRESKFERRLPFWRRGGERERLSEDWRPRFGRGDRESTDDDLPRLLGGVRERETGSSLLVYLSFGVDDRV